MSGLVERLLMSVTDDHPCGENLEYDTEFGELERAAQYKPEQQFGKTVVDAEEPKWKDVQKIATQLFSKTKDLRIATYLTRSLVHNEGFSGLADGLDIICKLLQRSWGCVHPQLDEEDGNDPTIRINSLLALSDKEHMVASMRGIPLVASKVLGQFSLRDIEVANGTLTLSEGRDNPVEMTTIDAAFMDAGLDDLAKSRGAIVQSIAHTEAIESIMASHVGMEKAPDLGELRKELVHANNILIAQLSRRGVVTESTEAGSTDMENDLKSVPITGEIKSREDVVRLLDRACDYFKRNEPSSPVPLLLQRAKRLVSADFMEVIRELAPEGLTQAKKNAGVELD